MRAGGYRRRWIAAFLLGVGALFGLAVWLFVAERLGWTDTLWLSRIALRDPSDFADQYVLYREPTLAAVGPLTGTGLASCAHVLVPRRSTAVVAVLGMLHTLTWLTWLAAVTFFYEPSGIWTRMGGAPWL